LKLIDFDTIKRLKTFHVSIRWIAVVVSRSVTS